MVQDVYNLERTLESIKGFASSDSFRITLHGQYEMAEENIKLDEVQEAIATGEIIENYPEHQRGPCCLLNGITKSGRSLHIIMYNYTANINNNYRLYTKAAKMDNTY